MERSKKSSLPGVISLHLAVMLFGMAGLFGKIILLPAIIIVLGRVFFAALSLGALITANKSMNFSVSSKHNRWLLLCLGIILAFHWYSFFQSIQLSTVALGLVTYSTFPIFAALIEPFVFREKFKWIYTIMALIASVGVYLVAIAHSELKFGAEAVIWGLLSGLSFAILTILNRKTVSSIEPLKVTFYQDLIAFFCLLPFVFFFDFEMNPQKWMLLILLGTVFTALAHFLFIQSLKEITAVRAGVISMLEPVYGIVLAYVLIAESVQSLTLIGGGIIIIISGFVSLKKS